MHCLLSYNASLGVPHEYKSDALRSRDLVESTLHHSTLKKANDGNAYNDDTQLLTLLIPNQTDTVTFEHPVF